LQVNGNLTLGANTTLKLYDAGVDTPPDGEYVLIAYTGNDPTALGTWSVDAGTTGWNGKVLWKEAENQVVLSISAVKGTLILVR